MMKLLCFSQKKELNRYLIENINFNSLLNKRFHEYLIKIKN